MFPKSKTDEKKHRKHKRQIEITMAIDAIFNIRENFSSTYFKTKETSILEFGCGDGFQIPYLKQKGNVVVLDVKKSNDIENIQDVEFVECSIANTPFGDGYFDIIYSNHVVEHIDDTNGAFDELIRIGKSTCIYAFSVPTNTWLLLSVPAQYLSKLKSLIKLVLSKFSDSNKNGKKTHDLATKYVKKNGEVSLGKIRQLLAPSGHGASVDFIECYYNFKIESWHKLFSDNGFSVIEMKPLLLYGPSEWPIVTTQKCKLNLCSSVLFLMCKKSSFANQNSET